MRQKSLPLTFVELPESVCIEINGDRKPTPEGSTTIILKDVNRRGTQDPKELRNKHIKFPTVEFSPRSVKNTTENAGSEPSERYSDGGVK